MLKTRFAGRVLRLTGIMIVLAALLAGTGGGTQVLAAKWSGPAFQGNTRTFPETGKTVGGKFLPYWNDHGGLAQQGYPISDEFQEKSDLNGQVYTVQYFERAVFELHPENAGSPYEVLLSQLGTFELRKRYPNGAPAGTANNTNARTFPETGKTVGGKFLQYWNDHGGLAQQGYPITNEFQEVSALNGKTYTVQYFERAVFELHPENAGSPYEVLLSQLGTFQYRAKYGSTGGGGNSTPQPTAAPTTPPAPSLDMPRFGVDFISGGNAKQTQEASAAGVSWGRIYITWSLIEPNNTTPANYNWTSTDKRLSSLVNNGIKPMMTIMGCPAWACNNGDGPIDKAPLSELTEFVTAVATRYSAAPYNVHLWEIWNEPDSMKGDYGWGAHGDLYAAALKAITPAVKSVDSQAKIAIGGLGYDFFSDPTPPLPPGPFIRNFVKNVVDAGGGPYFDLMNYHYYVQQPYYHGLDEKTAVIKDMMNKLGLNKPIIITETGLTSEQVAGSQHPDWGQTNPTMQSRFLTQSFVLALASGVNNVAWFTIQDWTNTTAGLDIFAQSGLLDINGGRKPAWNAYRAAVSEIGDKSYNHQLSSADLGSGDARGYSFGGNNELLVVWRYVGPHPNGPVVDSPINVVINSGGKQLAAVKNMYGEPQQASLDGQGKLRLTVSGEPLYVEWK